MRCHSAHDRLSQGGEAERRRPAPAGEGLQLHRKGRSPHPVGSADSTSPSGRGVGCAMNIAPTRPPTSQDSILLASPAAAPVAPPLPREGFIRLSPLNRRRLVNFKANRRGYWSFWIFTVLFVLSLFAEFIANDRPLLIKYDGHLSWPSLFSYSEPTSGGDFETAADYRDPYLQKQIADKGGTIIWPP